MRVFVPLVLLLAACFHRTGDDATLAQRGFVVETEGEFCCTEGDTGERSVGRIYVTNRTDIRRDLYVTSTGAGVTLVFDPATYDQALGADARVRVDVFVDGCPSDAKVTLSTEDPDSLDVNDRNNNTKQDIPIAVKPASPPDPDPVPSLNVFGLATSFVEWVSFEQTQLGTDLLGWFASEEGLTQYNVETGALVTQTGADGVMFATMRSNGRSFGGMILRFERSGGQVDEGLFTFGESEGTFTQRVNGRWQNASQLPFRNGVTDATYEVGQEGGADIIVSHAGGVSTFARDPGGGWERIDLVNSVPGGAISAVARDWSGQVLIVSPDGRFYTHDGDVNDPPIEKANLGGSPRRIRAAGRLAVISNFGNDTLTLVRWEEDGTCEVLETIAVGAGPVGIDVRETLTGYEIVSTGSKDNTYWITKVTKDTFAVESNVERPVPEGIVTPSHARWSPKGENHIVITGTDSNNAALIEVP